MLQKPEQRRSVASAESSPEVCELALQWPQIYEYLTQRVYADGSPRQLSSLLLFTDGPMFRLMLKDPDAKLCCWVSGRSLAAAIAALEAALCDPEHEWRADRQQMGDSAKRVKR